MAGPSINYPSSPASPNQRFQPGIEKNTLPSIPSLQKICNAFNISMSEFFMEEDTTSVHLNETRFRLLRYAERLNGTQLSSMLKFLESL